MFHKEFHDQSQKGRCKWVGKIINLLRLYANPIVMKVRADQKSSPCFNKDRQNPNDYRVVIKSGLKNQLAERRWRFIWSGGV